MAKTKTRTREQEQAPGASSINPERSATIRIGNQEYELVLTTRATRDIAARYGSLDQLGDRLEQSENFDEALGEIIWLVTLLANQAILIHNLTATEQQPLLTQEMVELLTVPADLADYKDAITEALIRGTRRNIISEDKPGNA